MPLIKTGEKEIIHQEKLYYRVLPSEHGKPQTIQKSYNLKNMKYQEGWRKQFLWELKNIINKGIHQIIKSTIIISKT